MGLVQVSQMELGAPFFFNPEREDDHENNLLIGRLFTKDPYRAVFEGWNGGHSCGGMLSGDKRLSGWNMYYEWLVEPIDYSTAAINPEVFENVF